MLKPFFLFLGVSISLNCFSQANDIALAKIFYTLKHNRDTNNKDSVYIENMVLLVGSNTSVFRSLDRLAQAERVKENLAEQERLWTGPGLPKKKMPKNIRKVNTEELFQLQKEKKLFTNEYLYINYLYEEILEPINWNLGTETKNFSQISCQKATAKFKGRDWVAWFAPNLPFEAGPWKLQGLPGLIVEAYDLKKEIQFLFNGFQSIPSTEKTSTENLISIPKKVEKVSVEDIKKIKNLMHSNPKGFWTAQMAATRGIIDPEQFAGFSTTIINNPIELPSNK